jgi:hypothetical protein
VPPDSFECLRLLCLVPLIQIYKVPQQHCSVGKLLQSTVCVCAHAYEVKFSFTFALAAGAVQC